MGVAKEQREGQYMTAPSKAMMWREIRKGKKKEEGREVRFEENWRGRK